MRKLVVLKLDGDLEQGIRVTLEIGEEDLRPSTEITGHLPPNPELVTVIDQWQSTYRSFGKSDRIKAKKVVYAGSLSQWREDCQTSAVDLRKRLNNWLLSESFRPIRETWLQQLSRCDEVRVLIRTSSVALRKLPWHLWDLVEEYPLAEVAYSAPKAEREASAKTPSYRDKVRILAILGNSTGINVQKDRQLLENLPDAAVAFLVEPQRQDINDQLWNQPWDILFFAGHSQSEGETGRIYINQTHSLTIADLKYALRNAVANGLHLAIFNSCDGLGLAFELEQLHIGQMIVMREPVPDRVAQTFLTYFLAAFASGKSFYLAEREARLKLQGLEDEFPCASWLPVIFQNPAAVPPSWQDLGRRPSQVCPYQGLFAFREEDASFFKGREAFTQMLVEAVQQQSLVAVIGPSGSGKSSVVFAGLIPVLRSEQTWLIESFRPGDRPLRNLAAKLVPLLETKRSETDRLLEIHKQTTALRQGDLTLRDVVMRILEKNPGFRLLLVVDQFEELYTLCRDARERLLFLDSFLEAVERTPNFTLVLTLRADFLGQALSYRPFGDALQYADLKLSPMNRKELQAAVEQPAMMLGVTIESGLTERILDAVSAEPGDLPLLEFALTTLWAKQREVQLTHAAYEEIGGVEAALARYAEQAYGRLNEEDKERARQLFIQLVRPGEGTEDTRRLATRAEVGEDNWDLVTRLASARLVVSSRDEAASEETVEIVHEALIGGWERLRLWIEVDRSFRIWQEQLRASLRQWEASGRDEGALLRGAPLAEAFGWLQSRPVELSPVERIFIQLGIELRHRERKQQERRRRRTILGLVFGLVVVSIFAVGAFWQWQQAELNSLSADSEALFASNQEFEALIGSIRAGRQLKHTFGVNDYTRMRVVLALQQAVYGVRERNHLEAGYSVSFSPDSKMLASASPEGIKLWTLDGKEVKTIQNPSNGGGKNVQAGLDKVSFSPDGKMLASVRGGLLQLVSLDGRLLRTLNEDGDSFEQVSFSSNGKLLASFNSQGTIKIWGIDGTLLKTIKEQGDDTTAVSIRPDGKMLASANSNNTIKLWSIDGTLLKTIKNGDGLLNQVQNISFSPDGKTIASLSFNSVKLWSLDGKKIKTFKGAATTSGQRNSVSFSPNGKWLVVTSGGNTVSLWNAYNKEFRSFQGHGTEVISVSFSPDSKMLASADTNGIVKLWSVDGREPPALKMYDLSFSPDSKLLVGISNDNKTVQLFRLDSTLVKTFPGHNDNDIITAASISPDGEMLASGSIDGTVKLWSINNGRLLRTLSNGGQVISLTFSSDSKLLVSSSNDHTVKLWNSNNSRLLRTLKGYNGELGNVSFSPDGKMFALVSESGESSIVQLWSRDGNLLKTLPSLQDQRVAKVSFSPDGKILALFSGVYQSNPSPLLNFWSLNGTLLETFKECRSALDRDSFSPDGKTIAFACRDNTVKLWSLDSRKLKILKGHNNMARSVKFSPDGRIIASIDGPVRDIAAPVKLWSRDGRELKTFKSEPASNIDRLSFSPDGKILALHHFDRTVILKNLDLDNLLVLGCDWLHDYLKNNPNVSESDRHLCDFAYKKVLEYQRQLANAQQQAEQPIVIPVPIASANQPQVQVESSSSDLAYNKPVKSIEYGQDRVPEGAVDDNPDLSWRTSGSTGAWIYVDLGNTFEISRVVVHWDWDRRYGTSAESWIEVSDDAKNWRKVVSSVLIRATYYKPQTLRFPPVKARYVRFYAARWNGGWGSVNTLKVYKN